MRPSPLATKATEVMQSSSADAESIQILYILEAIRGSEPLSNIGPLAVHLKLPKAKHVP